MNRLGDVYKEIDNQISLLVAKKREIEVSEEQVLTADGWKIKGNSFNTISLRNVDMVVIDVVNEEKNQMVFTLLCVNGSEEYHMKRFVYRAYLSNKHMLASKFKRGDLFNVYLLNAHGNPETKKLLSGMVMYKETNTYKVTRLYVKKPRNRWN